MSDLISRQAAIDALKEHRALYCDNTPDTFSKLSYAEKSRVDELDTAIATLVNLPSAQPERVWHPVEKPPAHHKDVIVRGVEAIGNVTVHKVMQWDVDTWRPTDYAPSIMWTEWSEI